MTSTRRKHARAALAVLLLMVVLSALLTGQGATLAQTVTATPTPQCPPGEFFDPFLNRCVLIRVECPAGKIDVHGDGSVCESLDPITPASACAPWPGQGPLPASGEVLCALPWSSGGQPYQLSSSVGCLDVRRTPYPRALVNLPVELQVSRLVPPDQLAGIPFGGPGSYRLLPSEPWATTGLYLHEIYGAGASDSLGRPAFDTRRLLAGDAYPYPSINNVRARLVLRMETSPGQIQWTTAGTAQTLSGGLASPVRLAFRRASFPLPGLEAQFSPYGPSVGGLSILPAYKLSLRTQWRLYLQAEWDTYFVTDAHEYARAGRAGVELPLGDLLTSYRAWDARQSPVPSIYCNAAAGYLPVPVIEAQIVLQP